MSPEPLRHEPGPRDWSPSGGYQYESSTTRFDDPADASRPHPHASPESTATHGPLP